MSELVQGTVLNLNTFGATIRLASGQVASAPAADVETHSAIYRRAISTRKELTFVLARAGRHPIVLLAPQIRDDAFEAQIAAYLKQTQEWEIPEAPPAHERHFLRKKKRAAVFESRHSSDS